MPSLQHFTFDFDVDTGLGHLAFLPRMRSHEIVVVGVPDDDEG
jgi:hypothetical protein